MLPAAGVRHSEYDSKLDPGMLLQSLFHVARIDTLTARDDHVLQPLVERSQAQPALLAANMPEVMRRVPADEADVRPASMP